MPEENEKKINLMNMLIKKNGDHGGEKTEENNKIKLLLRKELLESFNHAAAPDDITI